MSEPYEPRDPNTQLYLRMKWFQEWSPIITVVISVLALVVIGLQAFIYYKQKALMDQQRAIMDGQLQTMNGQLGTMNDTLKETRKGADAAVDAAKAAKDSASAANTAIDQNKKLISAAQTQADTSQVSARAAESSARATEQSLRIAEENSRGTISFKDITFPPRLTTTTEEIFIYITWGNDGNSNAQVKSDRLRLFISSVRPTMTMARDVCSQARPNPSSLVISPNVQRKQRFITKREPFTPAQVNDVLALRQYFGICGQVDYMTLGKTHVFPVCTYYDPDEKAYVECLNEGQK